MNVPANEVAEITLIGTGGYGESIVLHMGFEQWIIIDSCIDITNKQPAALNYLESIGIPFTKVKLVICTHWHDDHIRGMDVILEKCINAKFCCSRVNDREKFFNWVSIEFQKSKIEPKNSSTVVFNKCLQIVSSRQSQIKGAVADKVLINTSNDDVDSGVIALSPSDFTMLKFDFELLELSKMAIESNIKIPTGSPNSRSVALYVKLGFHRAILGADLEVTSNNEEGWLSIINSSQVIDKKASLFKIPHHGSENGYHKDIWQLLLSEMPVAKLTPWNKSGGLPKPEMLQLYSVHSNSLYSTSPYINSNKAKKRNPKLNKLISEFNKTLKEVKFKKGIVRSRINMKIANATWDIELLENALHLNPLIS